MSKQVDDRFTEQVSPHEFIRWSRIYSNTCRRCLWPESAHPTQFWATARPLGDGATYELRGLIRHDFLATTHEAPDAAE